MPDWLTPVETGLGITLPALRKATKFSQRHRNEANEFFSNRIAKGRDLDIVVCGSLAREEMSGASDFDYLIVAHGLVEDATQFRAYRTHCTEWCATREVEPPGTSGIFGPVVAASDLVERIGLEHDTNASLTRRILLLQESVSILNPESHKKFIDVAIGRYLAGDNASPPDVPRFLLNDICRYWRTVAVDYQAKVWQRLDAEGWALRFLKLRITRKLTFIGSVVPTLQVGIEQPESARKFLVEKFSSKPPLARLGALVDICADDDRALESLRTIYLAADRFSDRLADKEWRLDVSSLKYRDDAHDHPGYCEIREDSVTIQRHLELLFFDPQSDLGKLGRQYLAF